MQPPCWNEQNYYDLVRTADAEELQDHVFRAVHCPTTLHLSDTPDGNRYEATAEEVLARFLQEGPEYVQLVVLGQSGTGKSHFIQWLRLNIPVRDTDMLLTIPKVGMSLRGILARIIEELPPEERPPYLEKLESTGSQAMTREARLDRFLDSLAWTVQHANVATPEDSALAELLPSILRDPNLRRDFFAKAGAIGNLVNHIFVPPEEREERETRREFARGDLPLSASAHYLEAGGLARDAIDFIRDAPGLEARAIALMNRALEPAIGQTLNFSADDLIALMTTLRLRLKSRGERLILLIEDFTRLQGIDSAFLQALITPPRQHEAELCEIRWAVAVTRGHFHTLPDTLKGRCDFVIDMDAAKPASLGQFAAGYLNAVRIGEKALLALPTDAVIPNRCSNCPIQRDCWAAFGSAGDYGMFPFNGIALEQLSRRFGATTEEGFSPRKFLKNVLKPILVDGASALRNGEFPQPSLLDRSGGENRLSGASVATLERIDPENAARRRVLLEIWEGSGELVNLSEGIQSAFAIPSLPNFETVSPRPLEQGDSEKQITQQSELARAVDQWYKNNTILASKYVNKLRESVFSALASYINWDAVGFKKADVCKAEASAPFGKTSINFANQQTKEVSKAVSLELPLPGRAAPTAAALEGLVRAINENGWDFEGGGEALATFTNELELWAEVVITQLRDRLGGTKGWDPVRAAVELLVLGAAQAGRLRLTDTADDVLPKLLESDKCVAREGEAQAFQKCNERLSAVWKVAQDLLRTFCAGSKGGQVGEVFFLRAGPALRAIQGVRRNKFELKQEVPDSVVSASRQADITGQIVLIGKAYAEIQEHYPGAIDEEIRSWQQWRAKMDQVLGESGKVHPLVKALGDLVVEAENAKVGVAVQHLRLQIEGTNVSRADRAVEYARTINQSEREDALVRMALAATARGELNVLLEKATAYLDQLEPRLAARSTAARVSLDAVASSQQKIGDALETLVSAISQLNA